MPIDFPANPTNGQYHAGYIWNDASGVWDSAYAPRAATIPISSPNYIINGAFDVNQRGFTSTTDIGSMGFDRWRVYSSGGTVTYSAQQFTPGTAPAAGVEGTNFARVVTSGQSTSGSYSILEQHMEGVRTLAGQTTTVSFWAKAASGTPKVAVELGQVFGGGGGASPQILTYAGSVTLSTSWARYSVTITLPSISGKTIAGSNDHLYLFLFTSAGSGLDARTGTLGIQNNTIDFWGVQVEQGAVATDFRRAGSTLQEELAACQRYYQRFSGNNLYAMPCNYFTATAPIGSLSFITAMRVPPVGSVSGGGCLNVFVNGGIKTSTAVAVSQPSTVGAQIDITTAAATAGQGAFTRFVDASSWIDVSAEL